MKLNIYHPSVKECKRIGSAAGGPNTARNGLYRNRPPGSSAGCPDTGSLVSSHSQPQGSEGASGTPGMASDESDCATGKNIKDFSWAISGA
ncbi:MAG: hypothetical protein KME26_05925 [Oscillatoria princeps RMCB-10]|nr:hypothetical protein [Oscillatoria princeps RMCB-10]